jgi:hypothetical protein
MQWLLSLPPLSLILLNSCCRWFAAPSQTKAIVSITVNGKSIVGSPFSMRFGQQREAACCHVPVQLCRLSFALHDYTLEAFGQPHGNLFGIVIAVSLRSTLVLAAQLICVLLVCSQTALLSALTIGLATFTFMRRTQKVIKASSWLFLLFMILGESAAIASGWRC